MKKYLNILCSTIICITLMSQQAFAVTATFKDKGSESVYAKNATEVIKQVENNKGYLKASLEKYSIKIINKTIMPLYRASLEDYAKSGKFKFTEFKESNEQVYLADVEDKAGNFYGVVEFSALGEQANIHMFNKTSNKEDSCDFNNIVIKYESTLNSSYNAELFTAKMAFIDGAGFVCYMSDGTKEAIVPLNLKGTNFEAFKTITNKGVSILSEGNNALAEDTTLKKFAETEQKNEQSNEAELKKLKPGENPLTGGKSISETENNNGLHSIYIIAIAVVILASIAVIFAHKKVKGK